MRYRHGHTHTCPTTSTGVLGDVCRYSWAVHRLCHTRVVSVGSTLRGWCWSDGEQRNQLIDGVFVQTPYVTKFASNDMERVINRNIRPMAGWMDVLFRFPILTKPTHSVHTRQMTHLYSQSLPLLHSQGETIYTYVYCWWWEIEETRDWTEWVWIRGTLHWFWAREWRYTRFRFRNRQTPEQVLLCEFSLLQPLVRVSGNSSSRPCLHTQMVLSLFGWVRPTLHWWYPVGGTGGVVVLHGGQ